MKITIDIDCTAQEARAFFGLPDIEPVQREFMEAIRERMAEGLSATDFETLLKTWMPAGVQGWEQMQKAFWSHLAGGGKGEGGEK